MKILRSLSTVYMTAAVGVCLLALNGCGSKSSDTSATDPSDDAKNDKKGKNDKKKGGTLTTKFAATKLTLQAQTLAFDLLNSIPGFSDFSLTSVASPHGQSEIDAFTSAKFRVSGITLCGEVDESKGDTCQQRPWEIFGEKDRTTSPYDGFIPSIADTYDGWTDFLDPASTAKLSSNLTYSEQQVGSYNAVVVGFYRAFKIKSSVKMSDGATLYTKAGGTYQSNSKTGLDVTYSNVTTSIATAPAEDATFFLPNGGKTFFLQTPFQITTEDLNASVGFKMVLAYDPVNSIKGKKIDPTSYLAQGFLEGQIDSGSGYQITAPFMEFSPILARSSETIMRETYLVSIPEVPTMGTDTGSPGSVRLSLYYVKEDAAKAVRGVTSTLLYNSSSTTSIGFNPLGSIRKVIGGADGAIDLMYNSKVAALKGFKRLSSSTESGAITGTFCMGGIEADKCSIPQKSVNMTYTLIGSAPVDSEITVAP